MVNLTPGFKGGRAAQKLGTAASVEAFKAREVDRIRPTFYDGKLGIKGPQELIEQYKIDFAKRLKFPKGGTEYKRAIALGEVLSDAALAKKYNITLGDVERINRVIKKDLGTYKVPDKKRYMTGKIRREELEKVTDLGLEQEYAKLKKGERIGNPDLAHRVSKKYNVTTSNLGLDNPLINRAIVKPNERDISRLYDQRIKIENKYKLKDGTFKKPSNADIKALEEINKKVMDLASETKGRLSAIVNDPTDLNKPYGTFGIDHSKTIGGGIIDEVMLKDVRKLSPEDQAFLKLNLLELKKRELGKTPKMLADEYKDILSKPDVQKRIKNIIDKGNMEKTYLNQAKQILTLSAVPNLTTADQLPIPEKSKTREMFKTAFKKVPKKGKLGVAAAITAGLTGKAIADEELPIKYNDEIGAFVDPKTDDKVSQSTLLDWAANNPMPTAAVASAPLLSKTVRKGTGKLLSGLLSALGTSAAGLTFAGLTVKGNLDEGKNIVDATVDPLVGLELLYPEAVKRFGGKGLQNTLGRALSFGRYGAMMTPVGAGITALGLGKMGVEALIDERERIKNMTPEELEIFRAEQEEQMGMSA
jgi:hypothetical protein